MHAADLRLVFWETTAACNLACKHCRRIEVQEDPEQLSTADAQRIISEIAAVARAQSAAATTEAGRRMPTILVFSGGEPLMRKDVWQLADHARAQGLATALATNGTQVDATIAARIKGSGFQRVSVSIDGADAATHDAFRGLAGSFAAACAGLTRLHEAGVATQVNCTVARHNRDQLPQLRELAIRLGAEALHLFVVVPVGCGVELGEQDRLSAQEVEDILTWLAGQAQDPRLFVKATCAPQYYRIIRQTSKAPPSIHVHGGHAGVNAMTRGCLAGSSVCFISHKGEVFPCGYFPVNCGDLRRQPFAEVWRDSVVFAKLRDPEELGGACGSCGYKGVCGGCRARAYATTGDFLAEEPDCVWNR
jgi:radical SAM protein with 4Fe4S-binding SPASM domain